MTAESIESNLQSIALGNESHSSRSLALTCTKLYHVYKQKSSICTVKEFDFQRYKGEFICSDCCTQCACLRNGECQAHNEEGEHEEDENNHSVSCPYKEKFVHLSSVLKRYNYAVERIKLPKMSCPSTVNKIIPRPNNFPNLTHLSFWDSKKMDIMTYNNFTHLKSLHVKHPSLNLFSQLSTDFPSLSKLSISSTFEGNNSEIYSNIIEVINCRFKYGDTLNGLTHLEIAHDMEHILNKFYFRMFLDYLLEFGKERLNCLKLFSFIGVGSNYMESSKVLYSKLNSLRRQKKWLFQNHTRIELELHAETFKWVKFSSIFAIPSPNEYENGLRESPKTIFNRTLFSMVKKSGTNVELQNKLFATETMVVDRVFELKIGYRDSHFEPSDKNILYRTILNISNIKVLQLPFVINNKAVKLEVPLYFLDYLEKVLSNLPNVTVLEVSTELIEYTPIEGEMDEISKRFLKLVDSFKNVQCFRFLNPKNLNLNTQDRYCSSERNGVMIEKLPSFLKLISKRCLDLNEISISASSSALYLFSKSKKLNRERSDRLQNNLHQLQMILKKMRLYYPQVEISSVVNLLNSYKMQRRVHLTENNI